jgi:hypothetical protein
VSLATVKTEITPLIGGLMKLSEQSLDDPDAFSPNQIFNQKVAQFIPEAKLAADIMESTVKKTQEAYNSLLKYFGEEMPSEELFELIAKFATYLAAAHAENSRRRRAAERLFAKQNSPRVCSLQWNTCLANLLIEYHAFSRSKQITS